MIELVGNYEEHVPQRARGGSKSCQWGDKNGSESEMLGDVDHGKGKLR